MENRDIRVSQVGIRSVPQSLTLPVTAKSEKYETVSLWIYLNFLVIYSPVFMKSPPNRLFF
jgi:hypothetical protein